MDTFLKVFILFAPNILMFSEGLTIQYNMMKSFIGGSVKAVTDRHISLCQMAQLDNMLHAVASSTLKLPIVQSRPPVALSSARLYDLQSYQIGRLKGLHISIACLRNQIQLLLPSNASHFLG